MEQTTGKGQWKRKPVDPTRHHRESEWDYRGRAIYHFTLPVEGRHPLFGTLEGESAETAFVRLNPYGQRVCRMLSGLARFYEGKGFALKVLAQIVMPDHVHLVIQVLEPLPKGIGAVVRGFKSACTKVYKEMYFCSGENAAGVHGGETDTQGTATMPRVGTDAQGATTVPKMGTGTLGAAGVHGGGTGTQGTATVPQNANKATAVRGSANKATAVRENANEGTTMRGSANEAPVHFARIFAGRGSIWQQDPAYYHERILHALGQLRRMIDYVKDNPRRLWLKSRNPALFTLHRRTEAGGLTFTSLGNHFLLEWPDKQVVEMSRSATDGQVQGRLQEVMAAPHNEAVTYTAAISRGEQLIARTLRVQGYPLVVLLNDGFPKEGSPHERYYKPGGVYFDACAKGHLLLLEPIEQSFLDTSIQAAVEETLRRKAEERHYSYTPIPVSTQRYRFVALNEMAKRLVLN